MICFAALPPKEKPLYNFVKSFDKLPLDRLYIGDYWGYRGSYYLYENGSTHPYKQTCELIDFILSRKNGKNRAERMSFISRPGVPGRGATRCKAQKQKEE